MVDNRQQTALHKAAASGSRDVRCYLQATPQVLLFAEPVLLVGSFIWDLFCWAACLTGAFAIGLACPAHELSWSAWLCASPPSFLLASLFNAWWLCSNYYRQAQAPRLQPPVHVSPAAHSRASPSSLPLPRLVVYAGRCWVCYWRKVPIPPLGTHVGARRCSCLAGAAMKAA